MVLEWYTSRIEPRLGLSVENLVYTLDALPDGSGVYVNLSLQDSFSSGSFEKGIPV